MFKRNGDCYSRALRARTTPLYAANHSTRLFREAELLDTPCHVPGDDICHCGLFEPVSFVGDRTFVIYIIGETLYCGKWFW